MKTYYTELRKETRHISVGNDGWEVRLWWDEQQKTEKLDIPEKMPRSDRPIMRRQLAMIKRIAQAVKTKEEYEALNRRIDFSDWDHIESKDLRGNDLVSWANNTLTEHEFYNLLRYN